MRRTVAPDGSFGFCWSVGACIYKPSTAETDVSAHSSPSRSLYSLKSRQHDAESFYNVQHTVFNAQGALHSNLTSLQLLRYTFYIDAWICTIGGLRGVRCFSFLCPNPKGFEGVVYLILVRSPIDLFQQFVLTYQFRLSVDASTSFTETLSFGRTCVDWWLRDRHN